MAEFILPITQGDTISYGWTLKETTTTIAAATPIDLQGATILIEIRPRVAMHDAPAAAIMAFGTADGTVVVPTDDDGKVDVVFTDVTAATGTRNPALENCIFDIQVTFPDGTVQTFPKDGPRGEVAFTKDVTL
jgi:hypothetical protein